MMYPSNFQEISDFMYVHQFSMWSTNQPKTNKMAANDGQLKLTIHNVGLQRVFQCRPKYWKCNKKF